MRARKKKTRKRGLSGPTKGTTKSGTTMHDLLAVVSGFTGSYILGKSIDKMMPDMPEETSFIKKHKGTLTKLGVGIIGGGLLAFKTKSDMAKHIGYGMIANAARVAMPKTFLNGLMGLGEPSAEYYTSNMQLNAPGFDVQLPRLEGGAPLSLPASMEEDMHGMGAQEDII
jgi:hypothetical protein